MTTRRTFATRFLAATALLALGTWTGHVDAAPPDTTLPPVDEAPMPPDSVEVVQSWTLTPGGGPNGEEIGSRPNLTYQVPAGTVVEDTIVVFNLGNVPMNFQVYATDAFNNDDGEFDLLPGGEVPVDAGSWVTLAEDGVTLPPGKQAIIPITVSVPIDATPGDHVGAIVASNVAVSDNGDGTVVNVDRRTGTRLYVQVAGPLSPELAVVDLETDYHHALSPVGGSADVTFTVENRGNVRLGGTPVVTIAGPFGLGERSVTLPPLTEVLPGQRVAVTATLEDVPALIVDTTTVEIVPVDPDAHGGVETARATDRTFAPPIATLLVLLVLLLGVMGWRRYRRHGRAAQANAAASALDDAVQPDPEPQLQP